MTPATRLIAQELRRRSLLNSFEEWSTHCLAPVNHKPQAHHKLLINNLEAVERGEIKRLMVAMPPGSAKTTYSTVLFTPWFLAKQAHRQIILASNTADFAESNSGKILRNLEDFGGDIDLYPTTKSIKDWRTNNDNDVFSVGVGGTCAGRRADLILIDDPVRSRADAESAVARESAWDWYLSDLQTRLKPSGAIVLIMCMVGGTEVLLAGGTQKLLRDIRPGDHIATYDNGKLAQSVVERWANQGVDRVFEIQTTSGATVKANDRHPFLNGERVWVRLGNLKPGDMIHRLMNTADFILEEITSIAEVEPEEVFDIQVRHTENFIADGFVSHNTRWHEDDLAGRLLSPNAEGWKVVSLPAEAEEDDALGRAPGEFLWDGDPTYDYGKLLRSRKDTLMKSGATRDWWSLYQQSPRPLSGSLFKIANIETLPAAPAGSIIVRAWDLAATKAIGTRDPDWTVGVKLLRTADGKFVVLDVVRFRGGPDEVETAIVNTAKQDGHHVRISLPQDPGQAGKQQVLYLTRKLTGYRVESNPETGDKATRAYPVSAQTNVGNFAVVNATWNRPFIDELAGFPSAAHDDQVDALSRAFSVIGMGHPPITISAEALRSI